MSSPSLIRTSTFRLTASFGLLCAFAIVVLLGLVYFRTESVLSRRVDAILRSEAASLAGTSPDAILSVMKEQAARDPLTDFSVYAQTGERVAGRDGPKPGALPRDGSALDLDGHGGPPRRAMAVRLPWGETLVIERDTSQLAELKRIIIDALALSGGVIVLIVGLLSVSLSINPLRRVRAMQQASDLIGAGDLTARLPVTQRRDELDALALMVNAMMDEIERLVTEARTVGEAIAHELRTPLTRLRMSLDHAAEGLSADDERRALIDACLAEADGLSGRFRALLRIAAVQARGRRAMIAATSMTDVTRQAVELLEPLAAERGVRIAAEVAEDLEIGADPELLFEALVNILDNAVKFSPVGGLVRVHLRAAGEGAVLEIVDEGPGISPNDRPFVTRRFYRSPAAASVAGHGLGLSLVAAVADLHGFDLTFEDAEPGARVRLTCRSAAARPLSPA